MSRTEKTHAGHLRQTSPQPPVPHVRQRGDDHSRTVPYLAPPRPQVFLPRLCMQPHAQGVSTPPVVQPLRRTPGQGGTPAFAVPADMCVG